MSHVEQLDVHVKDLDALAQAAKELGGELVRGQDRYKWFGTSVGDYPLPKGFTKEDLGKSDHVIRIPGNSKAYEVGVVRRRDGKPGYSLLWDFWNGGFGLRDLIGEGGNKLKQEYSVQVAMKQARRDGYRVTRVKRPDGKVRLIAK